MDPFTAIVVYLLIWWVVLFAVLPWGVRLETDLVPGQSTGAPANPRLLTKALATTGISAIIWLVVFFLIKSDVIDFGSAAATMMQEDKVQ